MPKGEEENNTVKKRVNIELLDFNWIFDCHNPEDADKGGNLFRFMKILTTN